MTPSFKFGSVLRKQILLFVRGKLKSAGLMKVIA